MPSFRIRTLTVGLELPGDVPLARAEPVFDGLRRARERFAREGFEVQTVRVATTPLVAGMNAGDRTQALPRLQCLDEMAAAAGVLVSIGPLRAGEGPEDGELPAWAVELNASTTAIHASVGIAASDVVSWRGIHAAAATIAALSRAPGGGLANFRFAAAAGVPAATPFFPVAWHGGGPSSLAVGVEGAGLVAAAAARAGGLERLEAEVTRTVTGALAPVEALARDVAAGERWAYAGIDPSPAPLGEISIAAAIERAAGGPFGTPGTLAACAAITRSLQALPLATCGYAGLMLPVLEDAVLAARAAAGRLGVQHLLLCSAVCGTGLDLVPLPGDTPVSDLEALLTDVAALAVRLRKPLAARLMPVPGLAAGDMTSFDDPYLVNTRVLSPSS